MRDLLQRSLPVGRLVVAFDPGKVQHRVWSNSDTAGLVVEPLTLPVLRQGLEELTGLIDRHARLRPPLIAIEATGALRRVWPHELARRFPGAVRASQRYRRRRRRAESRHHRTGGSFDDRRAPDLGLQSEQRP